MWDQAVLNGCLCGFCPWSDCNLFYFVTFASPRALGPFVIDLVLLTIGVFTSSSLVSPQFAIECPDTDAEHS